MKDKKNDKVLVICALIMVMLIPFSITLTYIPLSAAALWTLIKRRKFPKDFVLMVLLYIWRFITLVLNGGNLLRIKDIYDKFGYPSFYGISITRKWFHILMMGFGFSVSLLTLMGLFSKYFGSFNYKAKLFVCKQRVCVIEGESIEVLNEFGEVVNKRKFTYGEKVMLMRDLDGGWKMEKYVEISPFFKHINQDFTGFYGHKHHSGALYSLSSLLFTTLTLHCSIFYLLPLILSLVGLAMSKSYIYMLPTYLVVIFLFMRKFNMHDKFHYIMLSAVPVIASVCFKSIYSHKLKWSVETRLNYWKVGLEISKKNFWAGVGYSSISSALEEPFKKGVVVNTAHLHNTYLNSFAETGLLGFLMVIIITFFFIFKYLYLYRIYGEEIYFSLSLMWIICFVSGFFETNFDTAVVNFVIYTFMGLFERKHTV